ncbi:MAG: PASTA domain-containing protein, partial [Spirochaetes bacterium]|nr:PASTA domain-containing protein [Spirochaetota bacterium]
MKFRSIFSFGSDVPVDARIYKRAIVILLGVIVFMGLVGVAAFFLSLRGEEKTLVPAVEGMELANALIKLQEKELYPRIVLRFSDDLQSRGTILEQDPLPGTIVKAGRRISLVVSRGATVDKVGNYIGQNLDEVKIHLQTLFSASRQLIVVRDPVIYVYNSAPAGTILEQKPLPETEIDGLTYVDFVVSRGPERSRVKVPDLKGLSLADAILQIEKAGIGFTFSVRNKEGQELPGTIVSQLPAAGTVQGALDRVAIVYARPAERTGIIDGLFTQTLPEYPYPLKMVLYSQTPSGVKSPLITVEHPGGE